MRRRTISRNEPCPCGSGKKYKKCCYGKERKHQFLPSYDEIDYGSPILDENFIAFNTLHEISAPRLLYSTLLMPKVEKEAEKIAGKFIERGKEELKTFEGITDVSELINVMRQSSDSLIMSN